MNEKYKTATGIEVTLTQDAYADNCGTDGEIRYYARAVDKVGNEYKVTWETLPEWDLIQELYRLDTMDERSMDDEDRARQAELRAMQLPTGDDDSDACDWDHPVEIVAA